MLEFIRPMPTLSRVPLVEAAAIDPLRLDLAERAKSQLGYGALRNSLTVSPDRRALHDALVKLDIVPFHTDDVREYKRVALRKAAARSKRQAHSWRSEALRHYTGVVPEFALHTALLVSTELPNATFQIDFISSEDVLAYDPFLVVVLNYTSAVLEVWDEPDFTAKRRY